MPFFFLFLEFRTCIHHLVDDGFIMEGQHRKSHSNYCHTYWIECDIIVHPFIRKPLLEFLTIPKSMRHKLNILMASFLVLIFLTSFSAAAQDEDEDDEEEDAESAWLGAVCCFASVIGIGIIFFMLKKKADERRESQSLQGRRPHSRPPYPYTPRPSHQVRSGTYAGYPYAPVPPQTTAAPPSRGPVQCDRCGSQNLRTFHDGYIKCNDCKHVFHSTETTRKKL